MAQVHTTYLRQLPAVDEILRHDQVQAWIEQFSHQAVTAEVRQVLDTYRQQILQTTDTAVLDALPMDLDTIAQHIHIQLASHQAYRLQRVINGTGVVIHTNLGRSLLAPEAVENLQAVAASYSNLEYDGAGNGSRYAHVKWPRPSGPAALLWQQRSGLPRPVPCCRGGCFARPFIETGGIIPILDAQRRDFAQWAPPTIHGTMPGDQRQNRNAPAGGYQQLSHRRLLQEPSLPNGPGHNVRSWRT